MEDINKVLIMKIYNLIKNTDYEVKKSISGHKYIAIYENILEDSISIDGNFESIIHLLDAIDDVEDVYGFLGNGFGRLISFDGYDEDFKEFYFSIASDDLWNSNDWRIR